MPNTLLNGVRVPQGTDQSAPQVDMRLLGQSVRTLLTAASLTEAVNKVNAARTELGWEATTDNPITVRRSDLGAITVWDGATWAYNLDRDFRLVTESEVLPAGKRLLIASGTKILSTDGSGKAVLTYGIAFDHVVTPLIATGDGVAAPFVSRGQWENKLGCDVFAYNADGSPIRNGKVRVNYIVLGW